MRKWQDRQRKQVTDEGFVRTLLGRERKLPDACQRGAAQVRAACEALGSIADKTAGSDILVGMAMVCHASACVGVHACTLQSDCLGSCCCC